MTAYFLRIEGVNLDHVIADVDQISVIRGGGLLLRQAVLDVESRFFPSAEPPAPSPRVASGASIGLFRFSRDPAGALQLRDEIAGFLAGDERYRHFTFVVDVQPATGDFVHDREALLARNRFRQLRQLSLTLPGSEGGDAGPCEWDGLRPADARIEVGRDTTAESHPWVSRSVAVRHDFGRKQKQAFYRDELCRGSEAPATDFPKFTRDLQDLADHPDYPQLNGKIAVIYLDGNGFGAIQARRCRNPEDLRDFDDKVQHYRRGFLRALVERAKGDPAFRTPEGRLRLETLLWGGDEIRLVVPAWLGLTVLFLFYHESRHWDFRGEPLTHAGGLVFCKAKAPIHRMAGLAETLAGEAKAVLKQAKGRAANGYAYLVLESVDFPAGSLEAFRRERYGTLGAAGYGALGPVEGWESRRLELADRLEELPKSQAYRLAHALLKTGDFIPEGEKGEKGEAQARRDRIAALLGKDGKDGAKRLAEVEQGLERCFGASTPAWRWLHLVELWDYLVPARKSSGG